MAHLCITSELACSVSAKMQRMRASMKVSLVIAFALALNDDSIIMAAEQAAAPGPGPAPLPEVPVQRMARLCNDSLAAGGAATRALAAAKPVRRSLVARSRSRVTLPSNQNRF